MNNSNKTIRRQPASIDLPSEVLSWLNDHRSNFKTDTAFAKNIDVDRVTLYRIMAVGSGSPRNVKKIKRAYNKYSVKTAA